MNQIGQRIKQFRKQQGLTQERLAEYLGVTDKAVSKWECGLTAPDLALIMPLARILGVSADELLGGKKEETDAKRLEYDERYVNYLKYDTRENYQIALQAVKDYPNDYKYLAFWHKPKCLWHIARNLRRSLRPSIRLKCLSEQSSTMTW